MAMYTVLFDLPDTFSAISGIRVEKASSTTTTWNIDNIMLESFAPIPEPGTTAMAAGAGSVLFSWSALRRRSAATGSR